MSLPTNVQIIQIASTLIKNDAYNYSQEIIITGLGTDNKIYFWSNEKAEWNLAKEQE